jgi:uncharacterized membrane protein
MSEPSVPPPPPYYTPPPPPAGPGGGAVSPNRSIMIVLSYILFLGIVPLVVEKEDREVQWHAKHGLVLFVAEFIIGVALSVFGMMLAFIHLGFVGCLLWFVHILFWVVSVIVAIICIVKGLKGERFLIPGISQFADRF